ncbi:MAG: YHS domain-containing protein [Chloroflexi bacterium]|nr:YHS domain-containing protein [Chloroflexota bacterium]
MQKFDGAGQSFEIDPVCEMKVKLQNPPAKIVFQGRTYYFCSDLCRRLFEREPMKYIQMEGE